MAASVMQRHRENRYRSVKRTRELRTSAAYETPTPALPTWEIPRP
jgi:hypothetical protein